VSVMHSKTEVAPAAAEEAPVEAAGPEPEVIKKGKTEEA
jgi:hypothetical protein